MSLCQAICTCYTHLNGICPESRFPSYKAIDFQIKSLRRITAKDFNILGNYSILGNSGIKLLSFPHSFPLLYYFLPSPSFSFFPSFLYLFCRTPYYQCGVNSDVISVGLHNSYCIVKYQFCDFSHILYILDIFYFIVPTKGSASFTSLFGVWVNIV